MSDGSHVSGVGQTSAANAKAAQASRAAELEADQLEAEESLEDFMESGLFTPTLMNANAKKLEKKTIKSSEVDAEEAEEENLDQLIDKIKGSAQDLEKKYPEMNHKALIGMKADVKETDDAETILAKVRSYYKDEFLADEALKFLKGTTNPHMNLGKNIAKAIKLLNERFGKEVRSGRNINDTAQKYARQGLGEISSLRDLYRQVIGDPKEPVALFEELNQAFSFGKMKPVLDFLLHSLGKDMKSKGPSIARQELSRLSAETRTMQAILGVYRFFFSRMNLISNSFSREGLVLPGRLTFELLAKMFSKYIQERYPSPDKALRLSTLLGVDSELVAQIIIFTQFRDGLRNVSPKLFRSNKHRQDLLMALIETISELDDLLEEEEDEDEDEEEPEKGWSTKDTVE